MALERQLNQDQSYQRTIRLIRPSVVVLCGPAACGKSTFALRHFRPTQVISSDQARALVCDDERDQRFQSQAFAHLHFLIEQRLNINRLCVVDSTALTHFARQSLLELARKYRVPCVVFLFDVPLETCVQRDQGRERSVGGQIIERQYRLFEQTKSSIRGERFDQIFEIRGQDLEKARIEIVFRPAPRGPGSAAPPQRRRFVRGFAPSRPGTPQATPRINSSSQPPSPAPGTQPSRGESGPPAWGSASSPAAPNPSSAPVDPHHKPQE